jgi:hypothetical protein
LQRLLFRNFLFRSEFADVFRDSHAAEVRAAHTAKVCRLRAFGGKV